MDYRAELMNLSNEILLHICKFLPSVDLISLASVCPRFQELSCDKTVVRHLDFSKCFTLNSQTLSSFLSVYYRCHNVQILNLNHCYWLPTPTLHNVLHLKNLSELHIIDCKVTFALMQKFINTFALRSLSCTLEFKRRHWTGSRETVGDAELNGFRNLKYLNLHFKRLKDIDDVDLTGYRPFVRAFTHLETLRFCTSKFYTLSNLRKDRALAYGFLRTIAHVIRLGYMNELKHLQKVFIDEYWLIPCQSRPLMAQSKWNEFWIPLEAENLGNMITGTSCDEKLIGEEMARHGEKHWDFFAATCFKGEEFCKKIRLESQTLPLSSLNTIAKHCPQLVHLGLRNCEVEGTTKEVISILNEITVNCTRITELHLVLFNNRFETENPCLVLSNMPNLVSLAVSEPMISPANAGNPIRSDQKWSNSVRRQGMSTVTSDKDMTDSRLWTVVQSCQSIKNFEVVGKVRDSRDTGIRFENGRMDSVLSCVYKWKHLQHLGLYNLPGIRHASVIRDVALHCSQFRSLKLKNVGPMGACVYYQPLKELLSHANNLKDLSVLQTNIYLNPMLFEHLQKCTSLERLCFNSVNPESISENVDCVLRMVSELPRLYVLYIWTAGSIGQKLKILNKQLAQSAKTRPTFSYHVGKLGIDEERVTDNFPEVHIEELGFPY